MMENIPNNSPLQVLQDLLGANSEEDIVQIIDSFIKKYPDEYFFDVGNAHNPVLNFINDDFDRESIITCYYYNDYSGLFSGYKYHKDLKTACDIELGIELCQLAMGACCFSSDDNLVERFSEDNITKIYDTIILAKSDKNYSNIGLLTEKLSALSGRKFIEFSTIQSHIKSWGSKEPFHHKAGSYSELVNDYKGTFEKSLNDFDIENTLEFSWAIFQLPSSDYMVG